MKIIGLTILLFLIPMLSSIAKEQCNQDHAKKIFSKCASCHTINKGGATLLGPNLYAVVGRDAGKIEGYPFSPAFEALDKVWSEEELDIFLSNPMKSVPGTMMAFGGLRKQEDRSAIICYLARQKSPN